LLVKLQHKTITVWYEEHLIQVEIYYNELWKYIFGSNNILWALSLAIDIIRRKSRNYYIDTQFLLLSIIWGNFLRQL